MRSEAQKKADKRYRTKKLSDGTKKQINATLDIDDYNLIDNYCNDIKVSKAQLIVNACKEYIQRYPVNGQEETKPKEESVEEAPQKKTTPIKIKLKKKDQNNQKE